MNKTIGNLLLDHMRAIRADIAHTVDAIQLFNTKLTDVTPLNAGVKIAQEPDHSEIAALKARVDRIERSLDLFG